AVLLPRFARHVYIGQALEQNKIERRPNNEDEERVAIDSVRYFFPARQLLILIVSQCPDVAHPPTVQITGSRMMDGVAVPPGIIRREQHDAKQNTHKIVGFARLEK